MFGSGRTCVFGDDADSEEAKTVIDIGKKDLKHRYFTEMSSSIPFLSLAVLLKHRHKTRMREKFNTFSPYVEFNSRRIPERASFFFIARLVLCLQLSGQIFSRMQAISISKALKYIVSSL